MILRKWLNIFVSNGPFHGFFFFFNFWLGSVSENLPKRLEKNAPKISEVAMFESDFWKRTKV